MKAAFVKFILFLIITSFFSSCKKENATSDFHSKASWVKVIDVGDAGLQFLEGAPSPVVNASDGGMYLVYSDTATYTHVIKLSDSGEPLWKLSPVKYSGYTAVQAHELTDHSLFIYGNAKPSGSSFFWYRISPDGKFMDSALVDIPLNAGAVGYYFLNLRMVDCADGGYMIAGSLQMSTTVASYNNCTKIIFTCKLNAALNKISSNTFIVPVTGENEYHNFVDGLISLSDNKFLIAGNLWEQIPVGNGYKGVFGITTCIVDADGAYLNSQFYKTGGGTGANYRDGFIPTLGDLFPDGNGNYITWADNSGNDNYNRMLTFDSQGNLIDSVKYKYPTSQYVQYGIRKKDGGFLLVTQNENDELGFIGSTIESNIINMTDNGSIEQMQQPNNINSTALRSCCLLNDGHYVITGVVQQLGKPNYELLVIKTDENGFY